MEPRIRADVKSCTLESDILPPLPLRVSYIEDPKEYDRFLKAVVAQVRRSYEYHLWTKYVKQTLGYKRCALTGEVQDDVTIELHHHPFCLQDICDVIVNNNVVNGKSFCTFDIAIEVIELHFQNNVGYIPLCKTLHEKYHNGALTIPINLVCGNWQYIVDNYVLPDYLKTKMTKLVAVVDSNHIGWRRNEYTSRNN